MTPFDKFKRDFQGKHILVFGLGILGRAASVAKLFAQIGCQVTVTDLKTKAELKSSINTLDSSAVNYRLGKHLDQDVLESDVIIRNPAVPWNHALLEMARKENKTIRMDTSIFASYFTGRIIGVTGTRGKTTTTLLIHALLKDSGIPTLLAGNATKRANIELLKETKESSVAVMELSSWELQGFHQQQISPNIAVVTNIYHDHLNRYDSFRDYISDKTKIFKFQDKTDHLILNRQNKWTKQMSGLAKSKIHWFKKNDFPSDWKLSLLGDHNLENAAAALVVGNLFNLKKARMKKVFASFPQVKHRLENTATINGVTFINDTTSTTPVATIKSLQTISSPIILLVGGNSKNLPLGSLPAVIAEQTKAIVLLKGTGTEKLKKALTPFKSANIISQNLTFKDSVLKAQSYASLGDVVLLSPGFTSFGEFANEFQRGDKFKEIIRIFLKK